MGRQPSGARGLLEELGRAFAGDPMRDAERSMARVARARAATADRPDLTLPERVELAHRREDEQAARRLEELEAAHERLRSSIEERHALVKEAKEADREGTIRRMHDEGDPDANLAAVLEAGRRHRAIRQSSRRAEHRRPFLLPRRPARRNHRPRARRPGARRAAGIRAGQDPGDDDPEPSGDLAGRRPTIGAFQ